MVGIRRAVALLLLGFYVTQFAMTAWIGPDELYACYLGLALCYGLAFIGLAAEWFWARWFAIGIGHFGSLLLLVLFQVGLEPIILFFGGTHLAVALFLSGEGMAAKYEYSEAAAERWNLQEESIILMRRAVKSAGSTIPILILYALGPRPELMQYAALAFGVVGLVGLLRGRTWGVLALGTAGLIPLVLWFLGQHSAGYLLTSPVGYPVVSGQIVQLLAAAMLIIPAIYAGRMLAYLRR
jgi:hypothetical protein